MGQANAKWQVKCRPLPEKLPSLHANATPMRVSLTTPACVLHVFFRHMPPIKHSNHRETVLAKRPVLLETRLCCMLISLPMKSRCFVGWETLYTDKRNSFFEVLHYPHIDMGLGHVTYGPYQDDMVQIKKAQNDDAY